jgi:hypothetical protein
VLKRFQDGIVRFGSKPDEVSLNVGTRKASVRNRSWHPEALFTYRLIVRPAKFLLREEQLMAATSSGTRVKTPRRSRSVVMSRKNLSTIFSHDAEVGVKCMLNRGCFASHSCTAGCLCVA